MKFIQLPADRTTRAQLASEYDFLSPEFLLLARSLGYVHLCNSARYSTINVGEDLCDLITRRRNAKVMLVLLAYRSHMITDADSLQRVQQALLSDASTLRHL